MQQNVGDFDRVMRLAVGTALVVVSTAGFAGFLMLAVGPLPQGLSSVMVFLVGAILLVTGAVRTCPIYRTVGLSTFRNRSERAEASEETTPETEA